MASLPKTCALCPAPLCRSNRGGYCRAHANSSPEKRAKISAGARRAHLTDPTLRERKRAAAKRQAARPGERELRAERCRRTQMWRLGVAALTPESRVKSARACSNTKLAWCPPHLRDEYRALTRNKMRAAEARRIILEQHEVEMRRWRVSIGAETPEPVEAQARAVLYIHRAAKVAAQIMAVGELWTRGKSTPLARARWSVFLALRQRNWSWHRIAVATGMCRKSVKYGVEHGERLLAESPEFAELCRKVCAA